MLVGLSIALIFFGFPLGALMILALWLTILITFCHVGAGQRIKGGSIHFALLSAILTALLVPYSFNTVGPFAIAIVVALLVLYAGIYFKWYEKKEVERSKFHISELFLWGMPILTIILSLNRYLDYLGYMYA